MAGLKQIKSKIKSVEKTQKVTKAMEAVSAAKMRKSQHKALAGRAYARAAVSILARLSGSQVLKNHPLTQGNAASHTLYIVITSDKGLAGALNSAVLRRVAGEIKKGDMVVAVGRKAHDFFAARGFEVATFYPNTDAISSDMIGEISRAAAQRFASGACRRVVVAYQNFVSTFEQRPTVRTIFPLSLEELSAVVADIVPRGVELRDETTPQVYTVEPSEEEVLEALVPKLAGIFVYHALLESQASEHSARMVAMKSASDKAGEMEHALTLAFNKARQAAITREVSEITGGMEAMSK